MRTLPEHFHLNVKEGGERLDVFLKKNLSEYSRSFLQKLIRQGKVTVNGEFQKPSYVVEVGHRVGVSIPPAQEPGVIAQCIKLDILFEDDYLLVVNKNGGMITHPNWEGQKDTLVNALLHHTTKLSRVGGSLRPGIVHRLDKDTSGAIIVAKTDPVHIALSMQFKKREVKKKYIGLTKGKPPYTQGVINAKIGRNPVHRTKMTQDGKFAREAITCYRVLKSWNSWTLLELRPLTGRTHQIRVHLKGINCFLVGDNLYGGKVEPEFPFSVSRCMLHAQFIGFFHPVKKKWMEAEAPIPSDMQEIINYLEKEYG